MARFTDEEIKRYSRQLVLADVGGVGQERLRAATAHAGSEIEALYLAAAGIGTIYAPSSVIAEAIRSLNPNVETRVAAAPVAEIAVEDAALSALRTISAITEAD
jgi:molybdopterin/thiamine biosynthesis adenylyltransferase